MRLEEGVQPFQLINERGIYLLPSCRIDDEYIVFYFISFFQGIFCCTYGVLFPLCRTEYGNADLLAQTSKLVNGGGTNEVACDEYRLVALLGEAQSQFGTGRRLAGSVEPDHEDARGRREVERGFLIA